MFFFLRNETSVFWIQILPKFDNTDLIDNSIGYKYGLVTVGCNVAKS